MKGMVATFQLDQSECFVHSGKFSVAAAAIQIEKLISIIIIIIIIIIPLFTLESVYSTYASGAEQMTETINL